MLVTLTKSGNRSKALISGKVGKSKRKHKRTIERLFEKYTGKSRVQLKSFKLVRIGAKKTYRAKINCVDGSVSTCFVYLD